MTNFERKLQNGRHGMIAGMAVGAGIGKLVSEAAGPLGGMIGGPGGAALVKISSSGLCIAIGGLAGGTVGLIGGYNADPDDSASCAA